MKKLAQSFFKLLGSLKLAVVIVLLLGIISAWGTIVESRYNTMTAKKLVYESPWMIGTLALLVFNLIFSALERVPWKKRHLPFLLAHIGIIVLILGSWMTQRFGIDGNMAVAIGDISNRVELLDTEVRVYHSSTGEFFDTLHVEGVDFLSYPPSAEHPVILPRDTTRLWHRWPRLASWLGQSARLNDRADTGSWPEIKLIDFFPYARRETEVVLSDNPTRGPAIRFQFQNAMTSVTDWVSQENIGQPGFYEMGPARVVVSSVSLEPSGRNEIIVVPTKDPQVFEVTIYSARKELKTIRRSMKAGEAQAVPWMNATFRAFKYFARADLRDKYTRVQYPTELTTSAVLVEAGGIKKWVGLNSMQRFQLDNATFVFTYGNTRLQTDFRIQLDKFNVGHYEGISMAKSYESTVRIDGSGEPVVISMNEPLKHNGYTFYQASFQEDETGKPTISVLSVNQDPGRWVKYLGSLVLVLGIILLFAMRNRAKKGSASVPSGG